ncbi:MAG: alpha-glucosidase C-terminal domain-containing protein, partial [FCB group bacterium]|nr:alpha-glucosidase C-terminal domain-containing protein [FCB group bacterium]
RRPMRFDGELTADERKFRDKMSSLLKLRQQYPALSIGDFTVLYEDDKSAVWLKQYFEEKILILFNNSDRYKTLEIPVGDQFSFTQGQSLLDLGMIIPVGNKLSVTLNPYETKMYTVK